MIVGADDASDAAIIGASATFYASYALKRVYYSAFSPTGHPSANLPHVATPLLREHRLYQSDWLLRFYGFALPEVQAAMDDGMLDLSMDPKLAWALKNRARFPVDVNTADREMLLRVPGLGTRAVDRIVASRRSGRLRLADIGATDADAHARPRIPDRGGLASAGIGQRRPEVTAGETAGADGAALMYAVHLPLNADAAAFRDVARRALSQGDRAL